MKTMFAKELVKLIEVGSTPTIIDVREYEEVEEGMIAGAVHIPLGELPNRYQELDEKKEYILICRSGRRSERACQFLAQKGFQVINLEGGMTSWEAETNR